MANKNPYGEYENFSTRLRVETTYGPNDVRDHRDGFIQEQYRINMQDKPQTNDGGGFPNMKSVTKPSTPKGGVKPRTRKKTVDPAIEAANNKDLKQRNIK